MSKTRGKIFIVIFMVMIALPYIIWPFISRVVDTTNYEKRQQAQMPELSMKNLAAFPKDFELDYDPEKKSLIVEYILPSPSNLPTLTEVKYIATKKELKELGFKQYCTYNQMVPELHDL